MDTVLQRTLLRGILTPVWIARSKRRARLGLRAVLLDDSLVRGSEDRRAVRSWIAAHEREIMQIAGRVALRDPKFATDDAVRVLMEDKQRVPEDASPTHRTEAA